MYIAGTYFRYSVEAIAGDYCCGFRYSCCWNVCMDYFWDTFSLLVSDCLLDCSWVAVGKCCFLDCSCVVSHSLKQQQFYTLCYFFKLPNIYYPAIHCPDRLTTLSQLYPTYYRRSFIEWNVGLTFFILKTTPNIDIGWYFRHRYMTNTNIMHQTHLGWIS